MAEKGVIKKFLLRIVLVTTQVAISRRVIRFMPIIGVARTQEGAGPGGGGADSHQWHGAGAWTRHGVQD